VSWTYYLFWILVPTALALISAHPLVLVVVVVALIARRWIPDPVLILRTSGRARSLQAQIELNPANATASVQLAEIRLAGWRPGRAVPLIEQALKRDAKSAELHYLLGQAWLRGGEPEAALAPLAEAVALDPKVRYGAAYLAIGDAQRQVGRLAEAIEAFERYVRIHTSSLEGYYKLARARQQNHDDAGARRARAEALETFRVLPRYQRRQQLMWWIKARFAI
jgi:tetratricopeptide (TPR) repeat protein